MSHSQEDYELNLIAFKKLYYKNHRDCYDYCATWFSGKWSNWQIYHNKPGQANTNSNIESFNNVIKNKYTNRRKLSIKTAFLAIGKLILSYSTEPEEFEVYPKFNTDIKRVSDQFIKANFQKISPSKYKYESLETSTSFTIILNCPNSHNMCSCTCKNFVKRGVCCHVVALDRIYGLKLFHPKYATETKQDKFVTKEKRGRKSKKAYGKALDVPKKKAKEKSTSTAKKAISTKRKKAEPEKIVLESTESPTKKKSKLDQLPTRTSARTALKK